MIFVGVVEHVGKPADGINLDAVGTVVINGDLRHLLNVGRLSGLRLCHFFKPFGSFCFGPGDGIKRIVAPAGGDEQNGHKRNGEREYLGEIFHFCKISKKT